MHALVRARIPYLPIHLDDLDEKGAGIRLLILPSVGALSEAQCSAIRRFVDRGGSLFATGQTSLYDAWAMRFPTLLSPTCSVRTASEKRRASQGERNGAAPHRKTGPGPVEHTYLRLTPELRARTNGPKAGMNPFRPARDIRF